MIFICEIKTSFFCITNWSCYVPEDTYISADFWLTLFSLISSNSLHIGDFNSFHPAWGSESTSSRGNIIYKTINSLGLCILNDGSPTRLGRPGTANSALIYLSSL